MANKRHTPIKIYDPVFMVNYYISYGVKPELFMAAVKRLTGMVVERHELEEGICLSFSTGDKDNEVIWIWTKTKYMPLLAHEATHAATSALEGMMKIDSDNEALAYTIQMLIHAALE